MSAEADERSCKLTIISPLSALSPPNLARVQTSTSVLTGSFWKGKEMPSPARDIPGNTNSDTIGIVSEFQGFVDVVVTTNCSDVRGFIPFHHTKNVYVACYTKTLGVIVPNDVFGIKPALGM